MEEKLIGITPVKEKVYGVEATVVLENYMNLIRYMNCIPIVLPSNPNLVEGEYYSKNLSALILQGGGDIDPEEDRMEGLGKVDLQQDATDFYYLELAYKNKIPVLGICRGMQIINVFFNGSLHQDTRYLMRDKHTTIMHNSNDDGRSLVHRVYKQGNGSITETLFKDQVFKVNSLHHEFINKLGNDLIPTLKSNDGVIEGLELVNSETIIIGVQFHPEILLAEGNENIIHFVDKFKENVL